tara:strand:+ start:2222 stop:2494 length:273 start_codon:yes stop_codon:yes gene_type:complete
MQSSVSQDRKVRSVNYLELLEGVDSFEKYLQEEYEALFDSVFVFESNRSDSTLDQTIQKELELRLDLISFVQKKYKEKVLEKINSTSFEK